MNRDLGRGIAERIRGNLELIVVDDIPEPFSGNHIDNKIVAFEHLLHLSHLCDVFSRGVPEPAYSLCLTMRSRRYG